MNWMPKVRRHREFMKLKPRTAKTVSESQVDIEKNWKKSAAFYESDISISVLRSSQLPEDLSKMLRVSSARGMESVMKAQLISAVLKAVEKQGLTHAELAKRSGLPRGAVTGILSGSLQKVTIDRVLRLVEAAFRFIG